MIALIAKINIIPGKEADFEKFMLGLAAAVNAHEPGCKLYTLTKDSDGNYIVIEIYEDEAALAAHGQTEHLKAAGPKFAGVMAGRPELTQLEVIG